MKPTSAPSAVARRTQHGIATLAVVMILFFVVSLVAAYTSRNLIFEQRTSANQYRSTSALEAAEGGVEWALAMLNHGRITAACANSTLTSDSSFRERYVQIDADGKMTPVPNTAGGDLMAGCVWNGAGWSCSCPGSGLPSFASWTPPSATGVYPAFRVRFVRIENSGSLPLPPPSQPGVIWLQVVGCTRLDPACLTYNGLGTTNEGRAVVSVLVGLTGTDAAPPLAALTARGAVNLTSAFSVLNSRSGDSGITVQSGAGISLPSATLLSLPGTPGGLSTAHDDPTLADLAFTADRMFASVFNAWPATFREQPAAVRPACAASPCSAVSDIQPQIDINPGRPVWIRGDLTVDGNIGSPTKPVLLVVEGDVNFSSASAVVYGLLYVRKSNWATTAGGGLIQGAAVAEGTVTGSGSASIQYDAGLLRQLRLSTGSMVRVPGGWKDFQ